MKISTIWLHKHFWVHIFSIGLLCVFLFVGFRVYQDYGVSIDEYSQIALGRVNYERIVSGSRELATNFDRYYGPAFETPLYAISSGLQQALGFDQMSSRHIVEFLYFVVAVIVFYFFLWKMTGNPMYGLLGAILLAATPRMFAESFYNSKDMAFLSTGIFLLYCLSFVFDLTWPRFIIHAVLSGFAMAIRPQAVVFVAASIIGVFLAAKKPTKKKVMWTFWYILATGIATVIFFPVFWDPQWANVSGFLQRSLEPVGVPTYYFGKFYTSPRIPWHHLLVWVGITSLFSVVVTSFVGFVWFLYERIRKRWQRNQAQAMYMVMLTIIVATFAGAMVLKARTYDGWRHIYYIYPSVIGFSVFAVKQIVEKAKKRHGIWRGIAVGVVALMVFDVFGAVRFMINNHPNEYVYFNALAGGYVRAKQNFDFDYWGISYKQLLPHLLDLPAGYPARIYVAEPFPYVQYAMAPKLRDRGFVLIDTPQGADVYVVINRDDKALPPPDYSKLFTVSVEGADLSAIYVSDTYRRRALEPRR